MLRRGTALALSIVASALAIAAEGAHGAGAWGWPVGGEVITGYRNGGDPYAGGQHRGIDIAARAGAPVAAATGGSVRFVGVAGSSGLTVSIRTSDGRFDTSYLHLSSAAVREGDRIERGRAIGAVGTSGRRSAVTPHLHFGVREAGSRHAYRNPLDFLPPLAPRPVREAPRGGPLPVGAPVRVGPLRAPVRTPSPARRPGPARRRVRVPGARRIRLPEPGRAPRVALPRLAPVRAPGRLPASAPQGRAPGALPAPAGLPAPSVLPAPSAGPASSPAVRPQLPTAPSRRAPAAVDGGPDLSWALACTGLLLAAACLGGPAGRGRAEGRSATWSRLRPLLGRR